MIDKLVRNNIKNIKAYEVKEHENVLKLDANENNNLSYLLNEKISKAIMDLKINEYPDSDSLWLRKFLGEKLGLEPENLCCYLT